MKKKIKPKLKKYSDGGKEIKKAENFFKRENKKNPERFGEHYAKDEKTLKDNKNSIDFLNNWYKDRLPFLYGEEKGNELLNSEDFKNNLRGDNPVKYGEVSSRTLAYYPNFQKKPVVTKNFNFRKDFLKNEHNILQVEEEILNKNRSVYIQDKDAVKNDPTILTHENSHKYDIFLPDIFSKDKQIIENTPHSIKPFKNKATYQDFYITTPTEVKSRLMQIRQKYNLSPTQTITQEDLKNFDPTFQPVDELKRYYNDNEFIELLNKVSENKPSQEQLPMARNGGSIKQFDNGGKYEWSKKDMTKTYPVKGADYEPYDAKIDMDAFLKAQQLLGDGVSFINPAVGRLISAPGDVNDIVRNPKNPLNYITPILPNVGTSGLSGNLIKKVNKFNTFLTGLTTTSDLPEETWQTPKKEFGGNITTENEWEIVNDNKTKLPKRKLNLKKSNSDWEIIG